MQANKHVQPLFSSSTDRCTGSGLIREDEGVLQPAVEAVSDLIADAQPLLLASR